MALRDDPVFRAMVAEHEAEYAAISGPTAPTAMNKTTADPRAAATDGLELIGVFNSTSFFAHNLLEHRVAAVCGRAALDDSEPPQFLDALRIVDVSAAEVLGRPASIEDPPVWVRAEEASTRRWQARTLRAAEDVYASNGEYGW